MQGFAELLIDWQRLYGRNSLPWQHDRHLPDGPYRVWLSEVMLQQTQVSTVLTYYKIFLEEFPAVADLAAAPLDRVLALWSGMGYYTRARNLHKAANQVMNDFGGQFPQTPEQLELLCGVGRSTAAAIAAFCFGARAAILDGNVKRVLSRVLAFDGDLSSATEVKKLWDKATTLLPVANLTTAMPAYTQALMDVGATVCHVKCPACNVCPVALLCKAHLAQTSGHRPTEYYPVKSKKIKRSTASLWLLHAVSPRGDVWLVRRDVAAVKGQSNIWAGLYCLPEFESESTLMAAIAAEPIDLGSLMHRPVQKHVLTHKDLWLHVVAVTLPHGAKLKTFSGQWHAIALVGQLGLPAPIKKILTV
jgi:A/G-specific adenine glycosylase